MIFYTYTPLSLSEIPELSLSLFIFNSLFSILWFVWSAVVYCSYLALVGALATEADYLLVPESPAPVDWQNKLSKKLAKVNCNIF